MLGAKDEIFRLLADRQAHRLIEQAVQRGAAVRDRGAPAAEAIIELAAAAIEQVRHTPTIAKVLADEPELVASFMRTGIPEVLDRFTRVLGPRLGAAMARGVVARRDPDLVTDWIVRLCLSLLFAPPRGDLRAFLAAGIRPLLEVESAS